MECAEATTFTAEEEEAYSSEDEASATPLSSTAALTALSGAISEADFTKAVGADARALSKVVAQGECLTAPGGGSVADDAVSEAAASSSVVDWSANAAGDAKKKRNRKQRYKDNLVRTACPPSLGIITCSVLPYVARRPVCLSKPREVCMCHVHMPESPAQLECYEFNRSCCRFPLAGKEQGCISA